MRVIFAGPTLTGLSLDSDGQCELRPPARQGDVYRAVQDGANVIGIIDGIYEYVPAIWHKEILFALAQGVKVFGAASMGALRAAECDMFGMVGIGKIYRAYASGVLEDDADVAQSHGPAETGFLSLSEPLVNVRATVEHCLERGLISREEKDRLLAAASRIFFKERNYRRLVNQAFGEGARASELFRALRENLVNQKLLDAQEMIRAVVAASDARSVIELPWSFEATGFWLSLFPSQG